MTVSAAPVVGLVPAAGRADRLGPLPCSKEIFPVGFRDAGGGPRPVCEHLLEAFRDAGVHRAFVLLRKGKWDVPAFLGRGLDAGAAGALHLAYLALDPTAGVPETIDCAYPFVADHSVALGFPDILFEPRDAFRRLRERQAATGAPVVLGLFPAEAPEKTDMVELDDAGRVRRLVIKQAATALAYTWSIALWQPELTRYLHEYLARRDPGETRELYLGEVIQAAIDDGFAVEAVTFPGGSYLDVGTPEDLERAVAAAVGDPGRK